MKHNKQVTVLGSLLLAVILTACQGDAGDAEQASGSQLPPGIEVELPKSLTGEKLIVSKASMPKPQTIKDDFIPIADLYDFSFASGLEDLGDEEIRISYNYNVAALNAQGLSEEFNIFAHNSQKQWHPAGRVIADIAKRRITITISRMSIIAFTAFRLRNDTPLVAPPACVADRFPLAGTGQSTLAILDENSDYYGDRDYRIIPPGLSMRTQQSFLTHGLKRALTVATCNGDSGCGTFSGHKRYTGENYLNFVAPFAIDVYLMYDARGGRDDDDQSEDAPWLSDQGYIPTGDLIETNGPARFYGVYKKTFAKGATVVLNGNRMGVTSKHIEANYWVVIKPAGDMQNDSIDRLCGPDITLANLKDGGEVWSGFIALQSASDIRGIGFSFDGGSPIYPTGSAPNWLLRIPVEQGGFARGSYHTLTSDASPTVNIEFEFVANHDVNGDGLADLAVGARGHAENIYGRAFVFHATSGQGLTATSSSQANTTITGSSTFEGNFGYKVSLGDVNGDGYADLAVGSHSGQKAHVFYSQGISGIANGSVADAGTTISSSDGVTLGYKVGLGDVNGDGYQDLFVGQYKYNSYDGRVLIFHSPGAGGIADLNDTQATHVIVGSAANRYLGDAFILGDLNSDGYDDLVIGGVGGARDTEIFYSAGSSGIAAVNSAAADDTIAANSFYAFSFQMDIRDINNDRKQDLVTTSWGGRKTFIFYQGAAGIGDRTAGIDQDHMIIGETVPTGQSSQFGTSVKIGDFNGDGLRDLAVGDHGWNSIFGRTYIFYGQASGIGETSADQASVKIDGETESYFGVAAAAGDYNGDGLTDIAWGACAYDQFVMQKGAVYAFHAEAGSGMSNYSSVTQASAKIVSHIDAQIIMGYRID